MTYSQNTLKNTSTHQDSIKTELRDTVRVPFLYVKTANKAFIEVKSLRKVSGLHQYELHSKDVEIAYYKYAYNKSEQAYDTLAQTTLPLLKKQSSDYQKMYQQYKDAYKTQKTQKIAVSVTLPVVAVLSFLLGFYLHR